jgi:hypothetical protein
LTFCLSYATIVAYLDLKVNSFFNKEAKMKQLVDVSFIIGVVVALIGFGIFVFICAKNARQPRYLSAFKNGYLPGIATGTGLAILFIAGMFYYI